MVKFALAFSALMLSGAVVAAPESLMKVDTAKGEILMEVQANGMAATKIIGISTQCELVATSPTKAEAEKALVKLQSELRQSFDMSGLKSAKLDFSAAVNSGDTSEFAVPIEVDVPPRDGPAAEAAAGDAKAPAKNWNKPQVRAGRKVGIGVASIQDLNLARSIMGDMGCFEDYQLVRRPNIQTADPSSAQVEAKTKAIAAAKKQAEDYAAALDMRVVRIIRVSEAGAIKEFLGPASDFIVQEMMRDRDRQKPVGNDVPVTVSITVDFALGPK